MIIPNTVAIISGGPHPEQAHALYDFLVSAEVERMLAECLSGQIPLRPGVPRPPGVPDLQVMHVMTVDFAALAEQMDPASEFLRQLFVR